MRIHIIQHLAHEHGASIIDWAKERHHNLSFTYTFNKGHAYPSSDEFDMVIILGGTMGAYEEDKYTWLRAEKHFIRQAIEAGKLILGICLGSQILADVLGSKVYPHDKKEIGFFPIYKTADGEMEKSLAEIPDTWTVFHWHGDTFDLPPGASHLFFSDGCKNQGFRKDKCFGFQFHGEANAELLQAMIANERSELLKDDYVQSEDEILNFKSPDENLKYFNAFLDHMMNEVFETHSKSGSFQFYQ